MQNIIFDWTGVIKDAVHDHLKVVNKMFKEFGVRPITLEELKETWKQPYMDFYNAHVPGLSMETQKKAYFKAFAQVPGAKPYEGMVELLKRFKKQNKKMVILSSDSPKSLLKEIQDFDLEEIFLDMDLEVHDKVDHVENLMKRNAMEVENTVIIGDSNNEIEAARKVGITSIAVTWGLCSKNNLERYNPDFVVDTVEELEKTINRQQD